MKILVATAETQGRRKNDFCWTEEGELVGFAMECDGETVDGKCGCKRSLSGLKTHKATTTIKVVEMDITMEGYVEKIHESLKAAGWITQEDKGEGLKWAQEDAKELARIANAFTVGIIVEKRGKRFQERRA